MGEIRISKAAAADIAGIARFTIQAFGLKQGRHYRDGLERCFESLAENSMLGRSADGLAREFRRFEFRSHAVFYRAEEAGILAVRVLHANMDASSRF